MICTGVNGAYDSTTGHQVLQAYLRQAKDPASEDEFVRFWNSLTKMEKDVYLRTHLPMLFYATKDV